MSVRLAFVLSDKRQVVLGPLRTALDFLESGSAFLSDIPALH